MLEMLEMVMMMVFFFCDDDGGGHRDSDGDDDDWDGVQGVDVLHLESVRCRLQAVSQRQTCTLSLLQMNKKRKENRDRSF